MRKHDMRHNRPAGGGRPLGARGPLKTKCCIHGTAPSLECISCSTKQSNTVREIESSWKNLCAVMAWILQRGCTGVNICYIW